MNIIEFGQDGGIHYQQQPVTAAALMYLGFRIALSPDYSLRSFFRLLESHTELAALNPFIPAFLKQFRTLPPSGCGCSTIESLVLSRTVEMTGYPGEPGMQIYVNLDGLGKDGVIPIKSYWLENLLDIPLKLGKLNHIVFGDKLDTFSFDTVFNLFEFIDGICWELSFHNLPAECRVVF